MFTVTIIIIVVVVAVVVIILINITIISAILLLLLLLLGLSFLVIATITIAIFDLFYQWNNNCRYSCHHTDMASYQNYKFFVCFSWFTFFLLLKNFFWGTTMEKSHTVFLCYPCHRTSNVFLISILHYILVFYCKFIWKSSVNFSFMEFIFVMLKNTYLLTYAKNSNI